MVARHRLGVHFWEADATKQKSVKSASAIFTEKRETHSVNKGFPRTSTEKAIQ